jgi:hypothetical protein
MFTKYAALLWGVFRDMKPAILIVNIMDLQDSKYKAGIRINCDA